MPLFRRWLLASLLVVVVPATGLGPALAAQTCAGLPLRPGEVAFVGDRSTQGVTTSWGGRFEANLGGAVTVGSGFSVDVFDDLAQNGFTSRVSAAVPRSVWKLSTCPVLSVAYSEVTPRSVEGAALDPLNNVTLGPGVGVGFELPLSGDAALGVHARPSLLLVFGDHARVRGGRGDTGPEGTLQAGFVAGALLRFDRLSLGVETMRSTLAGDAPVQIHVGLLR